MSQREPTEADRAAQAAIRRARERLARADEPHLDLLFREARTFKGWQDRPVDEALLRRIVALAQWGPTSMNQQPVRYVFIRSDEAKRRLEPHLSAGNRDKTMAAPVVAIVAEALDFHEKLATTFPPKPDAAELYRGDDDKIRTNARRNGSLQGAYFMLAARALGLDAGPMSGFDTAGVDETFFAGSANRTNFLCSLGYGDETTVRARLPRLDFDTIARVI